MTVRSKLDRRDGCRSHVTLLRGFRRDFVLVAGGHIEYGARMPFPFRFWPLAAWIALLNSSAPLEAAGQYQLAFWREVAAYENQAPPAGEFGNHSAFVHVWDENGQPLAGKRIYTSWGVLLGTTDPNGFIEIELRRPNGYDFQVRDAAHATETTPVLSVERPPSWGHYSFEIGFLFKSDPGRPGVFDPNSLGRINASGTDPCRDLSAPHTRSLAYYSTAASNYCSDGYALGNWTESHGQTFVASGNRIVALKALMAAGYGVSYYWTAQILDGGPDGPPIGPARSTRVLVDSEYYPILVKWGLNDVQVVPGRTYYVKITRPGGLNVFRVNRDNYSGGNYFQNGVPVPGAELMGLVLAATYTNGGPVGTLTGTVQDLQSQPLRGVTVQIPDAALYSISDRNGLFAIPFVPAGNYSVSATKAGYSMSITSGVAIVAAMTNRIDFRLTPATNTAGTVITPAYSLQPFEITPGWSSSFDASWGSAATFASSAPGQTGNALQVTRGGPGSSARVLWFPVRTNTPYQLAIWARCPSFSSAYWAECGFKLGNQTAQSFDENAVSWTLLKKFSDTGANGNGDQWVRYLTNFSSGASTQVSVGLKLGAANSTGPTVRWDQLSLVSLVLPAPLTAVAESGTEVTVRFAEALNETTATNASHYRLASGQALLPVLSAALVKASNVLLLTAPQASRTDYTLSVSNVILAVQPTNLTGWNGQTIVRVPRWLVSTEESARWKYHAGATDLGSGWRLPTFDDASWPEGPPLLGYALGTVPIPVRTAIAPVANRWTTYFRSAFLLPTVYTNAWLRLHPVVDDGAVLWLNGVEVLRIGMTNGAVGFTSPALRSVGQAEFEGPFDLAAPRLLAGTNVLAVELHQATANDPDLAFGAQVQALVRPSQTPRADAVLTTGRDLESLVLTWPEPALFLEMATNVVGPWAPLPTAMSPFTVRMTNGARFFRLRE